MSDHVAARGRARALVPRLALLLLLPSCSDGASGPSATPVQLEPVAGDQQVAAPGELLPQQLVARVLDAQGIPVRGARVFWTASAGRISPASGRTDSQGTISAEWELGAAAGEQFAEARVDELPPLRFVASADPEIGTVAIAPRVTPFTTYDGSGQVVHPDIARLPGEWPAGPLRLAITPYPFGNAVHENPSIFGGTDGQAWVVPPRVVNPLARPAAGGHLSDPDVLWVPEHNELWMYYRGVEEGKNRIWLIRSGDGAAWTAPRLVVEAPNHLAISPSVIRRGANDWLMWTVNGGFAGCMAANATLELRRSTDGITWSAPQPATLEGQRGYPWHVEVQWVESRREYWAMYNVKTAGSCTTTSLWMATSADGVTWTTFPSPVLARNAIPELRDIVYRATFAYDPSRDAVTIWHSGARFTERGYEWRAAMERRARRALFESLLRNASDADPLEPDPGVPQLTNGSAP